MQQGALTQELLPVIQADRDAAKCFAGMLMDSTERLAQAFARHRIEHTPSDRNAENVCERILREWLLPFEESIADRRFNAGVRTAVEAFRSALTTTPEPTEPAGVAGLADVQDARRAALIDRLGTVADLLCSNPLPGELGNVVYDLLRQAAAQISSDRLHLQRLTHPVDTAANADDGLAGELDGLLYSIIRMPMSNKGGELVRWRKKASERAQSILTALRARAAQADDGAER